MGFCPARRMLDAHLGLGAKNKKEEAKQEQERKSLAIGGGYPAHATHLHCVKIWCGRSDQVHNVGTCKLRTYTAIDN